MDLTLWLELILFIVLMGFSAFFSSSETALFSLSNVQLEQMRRSKHPRIGLIERMLSEPRRLIVTILIGNEFVNVAASVISAAVVIQLFGPENKYLNLFIMVPILLLVGEITPKTLAIRNNIAFASAEARPIELFASLIKPLRWLIRVISDFFITLVVGKQRSRGNIVTADMVRTLAHEAVGEGALDYVEAQFIDHIFEFGNKTLEDVMTPRSNILFLPLKMPVSDIVNEVRQSRHTKVPIYREYDRDSIAGILHVRDLLQVDVVKLSKEKGGLETILREPYFVPETKSAVELFHSFRERNLTFSLVVDEYGGITGIVTMEDLLECIFGDIPSPSDVSQKMYIKVLDDDRYTVDGATLISEFNEKIGSALSEQWAETVGGLLLYEYGELPRRGAVILLNELRFTVVEVKENRIKKVLLEKAWKAENKEKMTPLSAIVEEITPFATLADTETTETDETHPTDKMDTETTESIVTETTETTEETTESVVTETDDTPSTDKKEN